LKTTEAAASKEADVDAPKTKTRKMREIFLMHRTLSRKLELKNIENQDENRDERRYFLRREKTFSQTILSASLLLNPLQGNTAGVRGPFLYIL
jgi:hypothetical protein